MIGFFKYLGFTVCLFIFCLASCVSGRSAQNNLLQEKIPEDTEEYQVFLKSLNTILQGDPYLYILVDKETSLRNNYVPQDLVTLNSVNYNNTPGIMLRSAAAASLEAMAAAAKKEGLTLTISSAYRSYNRQSELYAQYVRTLGQRQADRVSARPGHSQHQLGLTVDFSPVSNAFFRSAEGIWVAANASRFGWSLSYPNGYEDITGYSWESWHYRYVGAEVTEFIDTYFDGIQQLALMFIHRWERTRAF
ncbi:MAG: M15 family metallopeptidase [Treponema sp.]|nr:M15 family metallopeptidase [Treponema sp.]